MRVHHLDCCTMCPLGGRFFSNEHGCLVAHCLLIETDRSGLVLVDTGIGLADIKDPSRELGRIFSSTFRPRLDPSRTAVRQVESLGFSARDVEHILVTHLDVDHAGGLPDFPGAKVHVHAEEMEAAMSRRSLKDRSRYRSRHWSHDTRWAPYSAARSDSWFGFPAVAALDGVPEEILAIPLSGHTAGHAAIAVRTSSKWLLHAGDGYFHRATVTGAGRGVPFGLRTFENLIAVSRRRVDANHARLRELASTHATEVSVFSAHDPDEFAALVAVNPPS